MVKPHILRVIAWMSAALLSFTGMAVSIRALALGGFNIFEILAVRSGGALLIMLVLLAVRPQLRVHTRPRRIRLHAVRNIAHYTSQFLWALSLTMLPMATVVALEITMPGWAILLAVWALHERLTPSRIGVVVLGILGVLVILRPGLAEVNSAAFLVLLASFGYAITMITTKQLTTTETTVGIVFWMAVMQFPMSLLGSDPRVFLHLDLSQIIPAFVLGSTGLLSHFCLSNAFRAGDATLVVPLDFMRVPLIAAAGWIFYRERLDVFVLLGALIIVAGVMWNLRAEGARRR